MMGRFDSSLRWMLAALLLVGGLPARQHSHAGGDRPHDHRTSEGHVSHPCDKLCADGQSSLAAAHAHLHFAIFGLRFTLPLSSDSQEHNESGADHCFVVGAPPATSPDQSGPDMLVLASDRLTAFRAGAFPLTRAPFACVPAGAAPLCDAARHERSGVQLI